MQNKKNHLIISSVWIFLSLLMNTVITLNILHSLNYCTHCIPTDCGQKGMDMISDSRRLRCLNDAQLGPQMFQEKIPHIITAPPPAGTVDITGWIYVSSQILTLPSECWNRNLADQETFFQF